MLSSTMHSREWHEMRMRRNSLVCSFRFSPKNYLSTQVSCFAKFTPAGDLVEWKRNELKVYRSRIRWYLSSNLNLDRCYENIYTMAESFSSLQLIIDDKLTAQDHDLAQLCYDDTRVFQQALIMRRGFEAFAAEIRELRDIAVWESSCVPFGALGAFGTMSAFYIRQFLDDCLNYAVRYPANAPSSSEGKLIHGTKDVDVRQALDSLKKQHEIAEVIPLSPEDIQFLKSTRNLFTKHRFQCQAAIWEWRPGVAKRPVSSGL
jgi:hypothetical protein